MTIRSIVKSTRDGISECKRKIESIELDIADRKVRAKAELIQSIKSNPNQKLDTKLLTENLSREIAIECLLKLLDYRNLTDSELTNDLFELTLRHDHIVEQREGGCTSTVSERLFESLIEDQHKFQASLYASYTNSFYSSTKSARNFLINKTGVDRFESMNPTRLKVDNGFFKKHNTCALQLAMTQGDYSDHEELADCLLSFIDMGYKAEHIEVMERHLSANGLVLLDISSADDGVFSVTTSDYKREIFETGGRKDNLLGALKYLADHEWYEGYEEQIS